MNWEDARYFLAAIRNGTLAGAARELKCEHTTVARRLNALETALGVRLFKRTPEGISATEVATDLAPLAEAIERSVQAFERRAAGHDDAVDGNVRLTTTEAFGPVLIKRLGELRERHAALVLEVIADNRVLDVSRGEADIALRFSPSAHKDLIVKKVSEVHWAMYASHAYLEKRGRPHGEDLTGHDVVGFDDGTTVAQSPGARWLAEHATGATIVFRGNSLSAVLEAVGAGMGISVLPCHLGEPDRELTRISAAPLGSRDLCLLVHADLAKVARVRAAMDFVTKVIQEAPHLRIDRNA